MNPLRVGDFVAVEHLEGQLAHHEIDLMDGEFIGLTIDESGCFTGGTEVFEQHTSNYDPRILAGKRWICFDGTITWYLAVRLDERVANVQSR